MRHGYLWVAVLAAFSACTGTVKDTYTAPTEPATTTTTSATSTSASVAVSNGPVAAHPGLVANALPDPKLNPGATDPRVAQNNIASTICVSGYTKTVRPPSSYTSSLKRGQMADRGLPGLPADYEEDHLIALEIGGNPIDERNLWPEPLKGEGSARQKDRLENWMHRQVCAGVLPLADAQREMATDWYAAWLAAGRP